VQARTFQYIMARYWAERPEAYRLAIGFVRIPHKVCTRRRWLSAVGIAPRQRWFRVAGLGSVGRSNQGAAGRIVQAAQTVQLGSPSRELACAWIWVLP